MGQAALNSNHLSPRATPLNEANCSYSHIAPVESWGSESHLVQGHAKAEIPIHFK